MKNKIIPYNKDLKNVARDLRKKRILSEVLLWKQLKGKALGYEFHRQVPMLDYIVDFYCHELMLAIEIDGISHDNDDAIKHDSLRQGRLEEHGVTFFRCKDLEVKQDINNVILKIEEIIWQIENTSLDLS